MTSLIIIILVSICLLFTRYKTILSLYDDVIIITYNPFTSHPSYVPNINNNDDSTCIYECYTTNC